jgi:nicotinamidase-related amidase
MKDQRPDPILPIPPHFEASRVGQVWRVPYEQRGREAESWARQHHLAPTANDRPKICLVAVDVQNTFCIPEFELFVGGRSGTGAVDDNRRLCEFIYRHLGAITQIVPTMDTHQAIQIFHRIFLVNDQGEHPAPFTLVTADDIQRGRWQMNPNIAATLNIAPAEGQRLLKHYAQQLKRSGKYDLTIWPYHGMLGGIGHALVSAFEEAVFFHSIARSSQPDYHVKGDRPFTEHYSVLGPEVRRGPQGQILGEKSEKFFHKLVEFDAVLIAGEAKSHCVAWTIADLLDDILLRDRRLAEKVYLLEDCTSPVVAPGLMDYTDLADAAFQRFARAGMHIVRSTDPLDQWLAR